MTVQDIHQKIQFFIQQTKELKSQNPGLREIEWEVTNVPYTLFKEYWQSLNDGKQEADYIKEHQLAGKIYCIPYMDYISGCKVYVWSLPVRIKQTFEVIEEIPA